MRKVNIVNNSNNPTLSKNNQSDSGYDIRAFLNKEKIENIKCIGGHSFDINYDHITISPFTRIIIPTGIHLQPEDYNLASNLRPRSGLSFKEGLFVVEGTIDNEYTGEIGIICINLSNIPIKISNGDRIGQLVFEEVIPVEFNHVRELKRTDRGDKGFGESGKN